MTRPQPWWEAGVVAGAVAGTVGSAPSTIHALATGRDVLEPLAAAGSMLLPSMRGSPRLLAAGLLMHTALSLGWGLVLARWLPRPSPLTGAAAGLVIAAVDLGVFARRCFPRVRALAPLPQVVDHAAYGAVVGVVLRARG